MSESPDQNDEEEALEQQQWLLETSLPLVFAEHDDALERGVVDPVVILVDCEDPIGGEIARAWLGAEAVDDAISVQHDQDGESETTVFAVAFPFVDCREEVPSVFPYLAPALSQPPVEGFYAISVTAGGASILIVPPDARPE